MKLNRSIIKNQLKTMYASEVAALYKIKPQIFRYHLQLMGLKSQKKIGGWNIKYSKYSMPFRKKVIKYFKTHTSKETAKHFKITHGQVVGIMETSRRTGLVGRAFKDKRNKERWTYNQLIIMVQSLGLVNRSYIAKKINRNSTCPYRLVKERMAALGFKSKHMHGMPISWVREFFKGNYEDRVIRTKAGPAGQNYNFCFKIIPWCDLFHIAQCEGNKKILPYIRAMMKFQMYVYDENREWVLIKTIKRNCL